MNLAVAKAEIEEQIRFCLKRPCVNERTLSVTGRPLSTTSGTNNIGSPKQCSLIAESEVLLFTVLYAENNGTRHEATEAPTYDEYSTRVPQEHHGCRAHPTGMDITIQYNE